MLSRGKWALLCSFLVLFAFTSVVLRSGHIDAIVYPASESQASLNSTTPPIQEVKCSAPVDEHLIPAWDISFGVKGPPTQLFRDNLRDDKSYVTSWSNAGFTNQFMSYVNMIYLGIMADRIPIIPPFAPDHHISREAGAIPFGQIFNMSALRESLRKPILEWSDVKDLPSQTAVHSPPKESLEQIGCWSTRHNNDPNPIRAQTVINNLHLDVSYTRAPNAARRFPSDGNDDFLVINKLIPYIFPKNHLPASEGPNTLMAPSLHGHRLPPDSKLSCFDLLYFVTAGDELYEWRFSWAPVWRFVGTHIKFTDEFVNLAEGYLRRALKVPYGNIPPFIGLHMRRGDFAFQCYDNRGNCLIPFDTYQKKVEAVQKEYQARHDSTVERILLFSDEGDEGFWQEAAALGWDYINHEEENTFKKYGEWYPPIIDIVVQSMAAGFVGTDDSTFSLVSARRVEDWNNGPTALVSREDMKAET